MATRNTELFLRLMNEANNRIAQRELDLSDKAIQGDPVRVQLDAERRAKSNGPLRAREHPGSRPITGRHAFGRPKMI